MGLLERDWIFNFLFVVAVLFLNPSKAGWTEFLKGQADYTELLWEQADWSEVLLEETGRTEFLLEQTD